MQYRFIQEHRGRFNVDEMCECFGLSRSGYYDWSSRQPSARRLEDARYKDRIEELQGLAKGRYGHRPIYEHLQEENLACGRDRTLRLMKELGIEGVQKKGFKPLGTDSNHNFGYHPNLLKELGHPQACDQAWVADTTYLRVGSRWCYLATVMDLFSRRIVGWSISEHNDARLVCEAFKSAVFTRGGCVKPGLMHHSDRGSTYASTDYRRLLNRFGIRQSMSRKGNCYDNAAMESFYGRYKSSSVRGRIFGCEQQARSNAFEYIEVFYNRFRKHASLGYKNPIEFEENLAPPMGGKGPSLPACMKNN